MEYIIILLFLVSYLFDPICFFKIANIKPIRTRSLLFVITGFISSFIAEKFLLDAGVLVSNLIYLALIFLFFWKEIRNPFVLAGAGIVPLIFDLMVDVLNQIFNIASTQILWMEVVVLLFYILVFYFVIKLSDKIRYQLESKNNKIIVGLLIYFYISILIILEVKIFIKQSYLTTAIFSLLLILQLLFVGVAYVFILRMQAQLINREKQLNKLDKQRQLEEYTKYLEDSEDDLRQFKHDYQNVLNSLKLYAQEGDVQAVIHKLDKETNSSLDPAALSKYKDVNHVHVQSIKSIIITKLAEMYNLKIPYNFECRGSVKKLPANIDELDLVRILGIAFDNAIEESKIIKDMAKKNKSPEYEEIQIMAYSDGPNNFEFEIRNRVRKDQKISTSKIQEQGFTTKKGHQGYGLANIRKLEEKYPDMSVSYMVQDGWFDFYMVIDMEDGDEDNG